MKNYLEQQYLKENLFIDEKYLEIDYIPDNIMHREQELLILSKIFIKIIENPFEISRKILIQGPIGVGKTLITKTFGNMILQSARKRNLNIEYIHINCRKQKSCYRVLHCILQKLGLELPKRGYSSQELSNTLKNYLIKEKIYLLLILDELNYLLKSDFDLIYSLSRFNDANFRKKSNLSLISIIRNFSLLKNLDNSTLSTLQENVINFKKYRKKQLFDILKQRITLSVKSGVFKDDLTEYISDICSDSGDVRKALNISRNSIKIAEYKGKKEVELEDVQNAVKNVIPSLQNDAILMLNTHQLLLLKSIISKSQEMNKKEININYIKKKYSKLCKKYRKKPRKNTQIWHFLKSLNNCKIISLNVKAKGQKGRTSYYSINKIPMDILDKKVKELLKNRFERVDKNE